MSGSGKIQNRNLYGLNTALCRTQRGKKGNGKVIKCTHVYICRPAISVKRENWSEKPTKVDAPSNMRH